jgi:hypothetical protein
MASELHEIVRLKLIDQSSSLVREGAQQGLGLWLETFLMREAIRLMREAIRLMRDAIRLMRDAMQSALETFLAPSKRREQRRQLLRTQAERRERWPRCRCRCHVMP